MRIVVVLALGLMLGACASATRGWNEQIQFDSVPPGAEVRTEIVSPYGTQPQVAAAAGDNIAQQQPPAPPQAGPACVTPCVVQVRRVDILRATFTKEGYEPVKVPVDVRVAAAGVAGFAGNVLIGGLIGMGIDTVSGATLEHFPNPVTVTLQPLPPPPPAVQPAAPRRPRPGETKRSPTS